jgi:hypothetical protein
MKRRLLILTALAALTLPVVATAESGAYGVAIRGATVNRDHSVTVTWSLENASDLNSWIAIDGVVVRSGQDRSTWFTTRPLSAGSHIITIEVREIFETYSPPSGSSCVESGAHWMCARIWQSSMRVSVPYETKTYCVVPGVVGLRLDIAKARIKDAGCSMGAVQRLESRRRAGTVLSARPKTRKRLTVGTAINLVVSAGPH